MIRVKKKKIGIITVSRASRVVISSKAISKVTGRAISSRVVNRIMAEIARSP